MSKKFPSKLHGQSSTQIPLVSRGELKVQLRTLWQWFCNEIKLKPAAAPPVAKPAQPSYSESLFQVKEQAFRTNIKQTVKTKLIITALGVFILTGIFPPWQFTTDKDSVNGSNLVYAYAAPSQGVHSHKPAGYALLFKPPVNPDGSAGNGVQIDLGRLSIEWAVLAAITGIVWMLLIKPALPLEDKGNHAQKVVTPPDNS